METSFGIRRIANKHGLKVWRQNMPQTRTKVHVLLLHFRKIEIGRMSASTRRFIMPHSGKNALFKCHKQCELKTH